MKALFEKRIGGSVTSSPVNVKVTSIPGGDLNWPPKRRVSWPFGKISLFNDHLELRIFGTTIIQYADIDFIEKKGLSIQIHHKNSDVGKYVYVKGIIGSSKLFEGIKECVKKNKLKIKIKE